ncbi:MAG TPA: hypothetical protein VM223_25610 [Planctomycetota bacterium]|nr:hypothetical protein [Planctomycetota bacterium]
MGTAITVLRRQRDEQARTSNTVRFVQLRKPIREILSNDGSIHGAMGAANVFRDEILSLKENTVNQRYRARLVRQEDLWQEGIRLGAMMGKAGKEPEDDGDRGGHGYYGGKWGVYLRAPDLWFGLIERHRDRLVPLANIVEIHRGITSGNDSFFFPKDCSQQCLAEYAGRAEFEAAFGVGRRQVASGKVKLVRCGEGRGEVRPIESKYLEPEVHGMMEISGFAVRPANCARLVLLVNKPKSKLRAKYVRAYIEWGESRGVDETSTCSSRATKEREWYDLTGHGPGALFWPMAQQYRHVVPVNKQKLICNHNLFDVTPVSADVATLAGILNSTWVVLSKFQYGRPVGVEGDLKTEVVDVKAMLVPDPTGAPEHAQRRVANAFNRLKQREVRQFLSERRLRSMAYRQAGKEDELDRLQDTSELDMPDRRELDDAVLEMIGVVSKEERNELLDALYLYLREFFELTRQKEEKAIVNKKKAKRRGPAKPAEIAQQIYDQICEEEPGLLRKYDPDSLGVNTGQPYDTYDFPSEGTATTDQGLFNSHGVAFVKGKKTLAVIDTKNEAQDALIIAVASTGVRGLVRIPRDEAECRRVLGEFETFIAHRSQRARELIEARTADADLQEKIMQSLGTLLLQGERRLTR